MSAEQHQTLQGLLLREWPALEGLLESEDLPILWNERFRNVASIQAASEAALREIGLRWGIVAVLKTQRTGQIPSLVLLETDRHAFTQLLQDNPCTEAA